MDDDMPPTPEELSPWERQNELLGGLTWLAPPTKKEVTKLLVGLRTMVFAYRRAKRAEDRAAMRRSIQRYMVKIGEALHH